MDAKEYEAKLHEIDVENLKKLNKLNILSQYLGIKCKEVEIPNDVISKKPFSSRHNTFEEYKQDIAKVLRVAMSRRPIPVEIFDGLIATRAELKLE